MLGNVTGAEEGRALGEVGSRVQLSRERSGDRPGWADLMVCLHGRHGLRGWRWGRGQGSRACVCVRMCALSNLSCGPETCHVAALSSAGGGGALGLALQLLPACMLCCGG